LKSFEHVHPHGGALEPVRRGYGDQRDRGYFMTWTQVKIDANAGRNLGLRDDDARYASFDHCFNYSQDFHDGVLIRPVGQMGVQRDQQPRAA
jgi:hypothetical protein